MKTVLAVLTASLVLPLMQYAHAHAGQLDPTFGTNGVVILPNILPASPFDQANKVLIDPRDGSIVVVGRAGGDDSGVWRSSFGILRLHPDGRLDTGFGPHDDGIVVLPWGDGPAEAHAVVMDAGYDLVVGGTECPFAAVLWLTPNGYADDRYGIDNNGTATFAINDDASHTTTLNAMTISQVYDGDPTYYELDFVGTYDGSGHSQFALGRYLSRTDLFPNWNPLLAAVDPPGTNGNGVATSIALSGPRNLLVGGYAQNASGSTQCVVANYTADAGCDTNACYGSQWQIADSDYGNYGGAFVDQFYSAEFGSAAPCYIDALASTAGGNYVIAGGREFFPGATRAVYFELNGVGGLLPYYNVFAMTPWGDNSIRQILPEDGGKWIFAGFSGADLQNTPDPVVARVNFLTNTLDPSFGTGGVSLLDFDVQDYAYGTTFGAALDAHGCTVIVGAYYNGDSDADGRDLSQMFIARLQPDSADTADTIFSNGFDPPRSLCGP